jgi:hypothetical protein
MLTYGIEIETILPPNVTMSDCAARIEAAGVHCYNAGYSHTTERTKWKVVSDGSLTGGNGAELVSPILHETNFDQISKVCAALTAMGARSNRSCGLHVHIGGRHLSVAAMKKLAALYVENEDVIDGLLPPSRRGTGNRYLSR